MNILKDMELFVRVVHCNGLAAAGRELGMTPSSVTMRIKKLEKHYQVKLLTRTTRSISLTDEGHEFYKDCLETLENISQVENKLKSGREQITGPLRITAPSDLGRQHIAPILNDFVQQHPGVRPFLNLSDAVTNLTENNIDLAIRYGVSSSSHFIAHKLADSRRVLCASPQYLECYGTPTRVAELDDHQCLTMVQIRTPMSTWYFDTPQGERSINIQPARSCDDGAQVRQWALEGAGIALKSIWDVASELNSGQLVTVLDDFKPNYQSKKISVGTDLFVVYPDRKYLPQRTRVFIEHVKQYFQDFVIRTDLADRI